MYDVFIHCYALPNFSFQSTPPSIIFSRFHRFTYWLSANKAHHLKIWPIYDYVFKILSIDLYCIYKYLKWTLVCWRSWRKSFCKGKSKPPKLSNAQRNSKIQQSQFKSSRVKNRNPKSNWFHKLRLRQEWTK